MTTTDDTNVIDLTAANGSNAPTEGESAKITGILYDEAGAALVKANVTAFTMTLVDEATGTTINSQTDTDVLDANNGTLTDVSSEVTYAIVLKAADNVMVGTGTDEDHILHLKWTWGSDDVGRAELRFTVHKDKI